MKRPTFENISDGQYFLHLEASHNKLTLDTPVFQKVDGKAEIIGKFGDLFSYNLQGIFEDPEIYLI